MMEISFLRETATKGYAWLSGMITSILGYFLPVKNIVYILVVFFIFDVIFGCWNAKKNKKERIQVKIIWNHTMPRMLLSIVLILGAYMWGTTYNQTVVCTYKIIGWFISGMLLYSIAENGYKITKWGIFKKISKKIEKEVKHDKRINKQ